ncbi:MAG: hypothetical protein PHU56_03070 [Candidatus Pacebacteria bacterium]|nr:hypothetical protein [Candidatus Paceibacterota bacterium]
MAQKNKYFVVLRDEESKACYGAFIIAPSEPEALKIFARDHLKISSNRLTEFLVRNREKKNRWFHGILYREPYTSSHVKSGTEPMVARAINLIEAHGNKHGTSKEPDKNEPGEFKNVPEYLKEYIEAPDLAEFKLPVEEKAEEKGEILKQRNPELEAENKPGQAKRGEAEEQLWLFKELKG